MDFAAYDTRLAGYALVFDAEGRVLVSWYNGAGRSPADWTLPGGGVEYEESVEAAIVREVREETGYDVEVGRPLAVHSFTAPDGPRPPRPYKSVRVVYTARIRGGTLGTLEVAGTTDYAAWMLPAEVLSADSCADIVNVALAAQRRSGDAVGRWRR